MRCAMKDKTEGNAMNAKGNTDTAKSFAIKFVCLAMLLTPVIFASSACDIAAQLNFSSSGTPTSADSNWKTLTVVALLLSGIFISVIYLLGQVFGNLNMLNRAKTDLYQFIVSAVFLMIFSSFVISVCNVDATQFGLKDKNMFDSTEKFFAYGESVAIAAYVETTGAIMTISSLSGYYMMGQLGTLGMFLDVSLSTLPFSGLGVSISALQYLANLVLLSVSISKAYSVVTAVIFNSFLNMLLPVGMALRCFSQTRELGGIFISLAIGLFIFYPLVFSLAYLILDQPSPVELPNPSWYDKTIQYTVGFSVAGFFPMGQVYFGGGALPSVFSMASDKIFDAFQRIGMTLLPVFVLPALSWIVIAMIVRNISSALGAEIDISSLARMV